MHRHDVLVHRVVALGIAAAAIYVGIRHGIDAGIMALLASGLPVAVLTAADRFFYGPKQR